MSDQAEAGTPRLEGRDQDQRRARLKLALRENLKRRKAQARGRHETTADAASAADNPRDG
ncbi:MAG: hypothetical protein M9932_14755 [Xanthobacteraceae bacterium]|nr:hypothetical protein [Xanthobacteraceae bacterium]